MLRFNWETDRPPLRLAFCSLKLTAGGEVVTCALELPSKTIPSAQLKVEPGVRITLVQGGEFALRPDDDLELDFKFRGIKGAEFTGRATLRQPKATFLVPAPQYYANVSDAKVNVELSLFHDQREGLWIEAKLFGTAVVLSSSERIGRKEYWKSHDWKANRAELELSDNAIDKHRKEVEERFNDLKVVMQSQFKFRDLKKWLELDQKTREVVVGRYAELEDQIAMFRKEKSKRGLDKVQETRYQEWIIEANKLSQAHPGVASAYQNHGLDNPDTLDIAKTYNKIASVIEEVRAWHDAMKQFKTDLHNQTRLDYRLYVKVDDREFDLVVTEGF
ncbi:MAG: hypothetical protein KJ000_11560 [Pirellulaceae bacterium]|nr:hypothetical protein [Pirellulaceae bacterium]